VARLAEAIATRDRWLALLTAVTVRTHASQDEREILEIALDEVLRRLGLDAAWIFLGRQEDRQLRFAASRGVSQDYLEKVALEGLSDCLCPEVFWTGHRMEARNTAQCPRMPTIVAGLAEPVAHACVPLRFEGHSRGVLNVAARPGECFSDDELRFLETLGHQICSALERAAHLKAEREKSEEARRALDDLRATQEQLLESRKMAVLGTFASGLAHEIRNPLNSIGLQLSILERRVKRLESAVGTELLELSSVIRTEISRLDALVGDFLVFSRSHRTRHRLESLDAVVDEVTMLLEPEARQAGVRLVRVKTGVVPAAFAMDVEKVKQVVINLVRNGIEAVALGGRVTVETSREGAIARLIVSDDGPGLPAGLDVFQLFVTTKPDGTGLGLPIAQQIVTEHGGEIRAETAPGGGARFTVELPAGAGAQLAP
jgi:signal transduction histidine kinase